MNINFKFHTYYTCRICKCIEHVPTTFFVNNLNCPILNTTIELVYMTMIPKCSNYRHNMIISNWWQYCGDYVWQHHCWIRWYRFCFLTSENSICTWTVNDLTIDINVRTNRLWPHFAYCLCLLSKFDLTQLCRVFGDMVHLYIQLITGPWFTWIRISMRDTSTVVLTCFGISRSYNETNYKCVLESWGLTMR